MVSIEILIRSVGQVALAFFAIFIATSPITMALAVWGWNGGLLRMAYEWNYRRARRAVEYGYNLERNNQQLLDEMIRRGDWPK